MKILPAFLIITLALSCATTPRVFNEVGYPVPETDVLASGRIMYHDNRVPYFRNEGTEEGLDLQARIAKKAGTLANLFGDNTRRVFQTSTLSGSGPAATFEWACEYRFKPDDIYGRHDYVFRVTKAPQEIVVPDLRTSGQNQEASLPFEVLGAEVQGMAVRVVATRDLLTWSSEPGMTTSTWSSFRDSDQKFQVVNENDEVLAEVEGLGGYLMGEFEYRVLATTSQTMKTSMVTFLGMVVSLNHFVSALDEYRNGWSPDVRKTSERKYGWEDWPLY